MSTPISTDPILAVRGAAKRFGAVEALRGVDLSVVTGSVHALCGDNGAGKSTLVKLLAGVERPDRGEIRLRGRTLRLARPQDALRAGIATIHQDLGLAPGLTIWENVFMGSEMTRRVMGLPLLDKRAMRAEAKRHMAALAPSLSDMDAPVDDLSGGQRQAVAICRALRWSAEIVILDEPTAALGVRETEQVLELIRRLRAGGKTVILVSHNMADVAAVADRVTILRRGRTQAELDTADADADRLAHLILSGETAAAAP